MSNFKVPSPDRLIDHLTAEEEKVIEPLLERIEKELIECRETVAGGGEISIVLGPNVPDAVGRRVASLYDTKGWMTTYTPSDKTLSLRQPNSVGDFAQRGWRNAVANVKDVAKTLLG